MSDVLLLAATAPKEAVLVEAVAKLHAVGRKVYLAGLTPVTVSHKNLGLDGLRALPASAEGHGPAFFRAVSRLSLAERMWRYVELDRWVLARAARAEVLVALDPHAVYSVWELAQRHPATHARFGIGAALKVLASPAGAVKPTPAAPRQRPGHALSRRGVEALDRWRPLRTAALSLPLSTRRRADLLGSLVGHHLDQGRRPENLREAYGAELTLADELMRRGDIEGAAASFAQAVRLAFHRAAHLDSTWSPLAAAPEEFVRPLCDSDVYRALTRPRGRAAPTDPPPGDRPTRVLIVTNGNANFLGDLSSHLSGHDEVELQMLDPVELGRRPVVARDLYQLVASELDGSQRAQRWTERKLRPYLDWADVVFVDWCTSFTHLLTLVDPGTTRVIVRLHSYEAFTVWPQLLDYSRVDRMVFVSDHLRDLTVAAVPALRSGAGPEIHVVPNAVDLRRFRRPKRDGARHILAVVGYHVVAKDVRWALEVLRRLRAQDGRYRLVLIGADFESGHNAATRAYGDALRRELAPLEASGGVVRLGRTEDVPGVLTQAGVVLSSSVREGSPLAVLEGAASGAVPVVRDWPFFAGRSHGPRTIYPPGWVVDTVEEAVRRILSVTCDEQTWRGESRAASEQAINAFDMMTLDKAYQRLFFE